jgi:heme A synthase
VATPWALASWSVPAAVVAVIVLIGLPTVFATPGDKARPVVAVPGPVTILLVILQLAAAVVAAWFAWPTLVAIAVSLLALATVITEQPRWRWLRTARA